MTDSLGLKGSGMPSWAVELPKLDGSNCSRRERNEGKVGLKEAEKTGTNWEGSDVSNRKHDPAVLRLYLASVAMCRRSAHPPHSAL